MKRILSTTLIVVMLLVGPHIQAGRAQSTEDPISTVNGQAISIKEYQDRTRYIRWQFAEGLRSVYNDQGATDLVRQLAEDLADTDSWDEQILSRMEDEILMEQAAPEFGITIDEAAVQAQVDRYLRMQDENLPDNREALDAAAAAYFAEAAAEAHVTQEVILRDFYAVVLGQAMMAEFIQAVPTEGLQVHCRQILLAYNPDALARANEILTALEAGGDFAALARTESDDRDSAANSGDIGWASPNVYVPEFAEAVTNAPIGEVIGPIETQYGYHIIQVLERETRPVPDEELSMRRMHALPEWLDEQKAAATIERREDWADFTPDDPSYDELLGDILPLNSPTN